MSFSSNLTPYLDAAPVFHAPPDALPAPSMVVLYKPECPHCQALDGLLGDIHDYREARGVPLFAMQPPTGSFAVVPIIGGRTASGTEVHWSPTTPRNGDTLKQFVRVLEGSEGT